MEIDWRRLPTGASGAFQPAPARIRGGSTRLSQPSWRPTNWIGSGRGNFNFTMNHLHIRFDSIHFSLFNSVGFFFFFYFWIFGNQNLLLICFLYLIFCCYFLVWFHSIGNRLARRWTWAPATPLINVDDVTRTLSNEDVASWQGKSWILKKEKQNKNNN